MKKTYNILFLLIIILSLCACASSTIPVMINRNATEQITKPCAFDVMVTGKTIYTDEKETIDIAQILKDEMIERLKKIGSYAKDVDDSVNKYVIIADVVKYRPGNTAGRAFMGINKYNTEMITNCFICKLNVIDGEYQVDKQRLASFPVRGIYTKNGNGILIDMLTGIGAWKDIITRTGYEIISTIEKTFIN